MIFFDSNIQQYGWMARAENEFLELYCPVKLPHREIQFPNRCFLNQKGSYILKTSVARYYTRTVFCTLLF